MFVYFIGNRTGCKVGGVPVNIKDICFGMFYVLQSIFLFADKPEKNLMSVSHAV